MQFILDLLSELIVVDLSLLVQVEPAHVRSHGAVAHLLDQILDFLEEALDLVALANLVVLMLLLALVERFQVFVAGVDKVELDV